MKLRYVLVFIMGMACMYWLVRSGALTIDPVFKYDEAVSLTGSAMSGDIVDVISTGDVTT